MFASLQVAVGRGRGTLSVHVRRDGRPPTRRRIGWLVFALVVPMITVIGVQGLGSLTGWYGLDRLMNAPGAPWVDVLTAATIGLLLVPAVLIALRLRIAAERSDGVRSVTVTILLTTVEALSLAIAAGFLALFVVHLFADGIACARGVLSAC